MRILFSKHAKWEIPEALDSDIVTHIYKNRKYSENIEIYLENNIKHYWPKTSELKNIEYALNATYNAIKNNITIGIVGDYDADGSIATSLLISFFKIYNVSYIAKIPNRFVDGYGITSKILKELNTKFVITVDNGTSAYEAIDYAKENNIELIILDHHTISKLIDVKGFVNPCQDNSIIGAPCAAGLTFYFLSELNKKLSKSVNMYDFLDKVALATICDCVPLQGFNRAIVQLGLNKFNTNPSSAFKYMIISEVSTYNLGFNFGPMINVSGRFGCADNTINLLTSNDDREIEILTLKIAALNLERRKLDTEILEEAEKQNPEGFCKLYVGKWHEGVIGIVAGRLTAKYNCPVIVLTECEENKYKASARSIDNFDISLLIKTGIAEELISFGGGHAMAGGFTMSRDNLEAFQKFVYEYSEKHKVSNDKVYKVDAIISIHAITKTLLENISKLGPFGMNNNVLLFLIPCVQITHFKTISNKHIILFFSDTLNTKTLSTMIFNSDISYFSNLISKNKVNAHLLVNISNYKSNVSINIIDYIIN